LDLRELDVSGRHGFYNLYSSANITDIRSNRIRWTGHEAHREMRNPYNIQCQYPKETDCLGITRHNMILRLPEIQDGPNLETTPPNITLATKK
jgi:hypothetical protein